MKKTKVTKNPIEDFYLSSYYVLRNEKINKILNSLREDLNENFLKFISFIYENTEKDSTKKIILNEINFFFSDYKIFFKKINSCFFYSESETRVKITIFKSFYDKNEELRNYIDFLKKDPNLQLENVLEKFTTDTKIFDKKTHIKTLQFVFIKNKTTTKNLINSKKLQSFKDLPDNIKFILNEINEIPLDFFTFYRFFNRLKKLFFKLDNVLSEKRRIFKDTDFDRYRIKINSTPLNDFEKFIVDSQNMLKSQILNNLENESPFKNLVLVDLTPDEVLIEGSNCFFYPKIFFQIYSKKFLLRIEGSVSEEDAKSCLRTNLTYLKKILKDNFLKKLDYSGSDLKVEIKLIKASIPNLKEPLTKITKEKLYLLMEQSPELNLEYRFWITENLRKKQRQLELEKLGKEKKGTLING